MLLLPFHPMSLVLTDIKSIAINELLPLQCSIVLCEGSSVKVSVLDVKVGLRLAGNDGGESTGRPIQHVIRPTFKFR